MRSWFLEHQRGQTHAHRFTPHTPHHPLHPFVMCFVRIRAFYMAFRKGLPGTVWVGGMVRMGHGGWLDRMSVGGVVRLGMSDDCVGRFLMRQPSGRSICSDIFLWSFGSYFGSWPHLHNLTRLTGYTESYRRTNAIVTPYPIAYSPNPHHSDAILTPSHYTHTHTHTHNLASQSGGHDTTEGFTSATDMAATFPKGKLSPTRLSRCVDRYPIHTVQHSIHTHTHTHTFWLPPPMLLRNNLTR